MKTGGGGGEGGENSSAEKLGDQNWANVQVPNFLSTLCFFIFSPQPTCLSSHIIFQPPYSGEQWGEGVSHLRGAGLASGQPPP